VHGAIPDEETEAGSIPAHTSGCMYGTEVVRVHYSSQI